MGNKDRLESVGKKETDSVRAPLDYYLQEISSHNPLTSQEEKRLARRIKKGDKKAQKKLIEGNLRFVIAVARKYQNRGLSLIDLISEGNVGLVRAAKKFDGKKRVRFISYAVWWVRQAILQALAERSRIIRIPINRHSQIRKCRRLENQIIQKEGSCSLARLTQEMSMGLKELQKLLSVSGEADSLDAFLPGHDKNSLFDVTSSLEESDPLDFVERMNLKEKIEMVLGTLKEREAKIIRMYYGLGQYEPMTLEEIGTIFGITRERVRQIKEKALDRLRHPSRRKPLEDYY